MKAHSTTAGNYQLEDLGNGVFELHYTGDGWQSVTRTREQVEQSKDFFELWNNPPKSYEPNGTPDEVKAGILHSIGGYYVSNEGTKANPNFHVWIPNGTHAECDSAYNEISLAVARCNYCAENKVKIVYNPI